MKGLIKELAGAALMLWLVSAAACLVAGGLGDERQVMLTSEPTAISQERVSQGVYLLRADAVTEIELEEYVAGVILCEMPGDFHLEAKKAQAVAARTFALRICAQGIKHGNGTICDQAGCCQGYLTVEAYLDGGGTQQAVELAEQAAAETAGLVMTYGGALIEATYFSCSGGRTEDAAAVWGTQVPYLQAVDSPGEEASAYYTDTVSFSAQAFQEALGVTLSGSPKQWFGAVTRTDGGGVQTMAIGEKEYFGTQLRTLLGLRSANFTVTALSDSVLITTRGFGHRVGMSQYGADAMAETGSGFTEILLHYYQGVTVQSWQP